MYIDTIFNGFMLDVWCWSRRWEIYVYVAQLHCQVCTEQQRVTTCRLALATATHSSFMNHDRPKCFSNFNFHVYTNYVYSIQKRYTKKTRKIYCKPMMIKTCIYLERKHFLNFLLKCIQLQLLVVETNTYFYIHKIPVRYAHYIFCE